ncbi:hypothetical protein [Burkholderia gladioli]|uniref:hypothetical protein n=1 Tax=Burkholderia gladioli TaxID=28095 RepID=UPI00163FE5A3|nr:hypothetical protein [Burkholderia gladioli]
MIGGTSRFVCGDESFVGLVEIADPDHQVAPVRSGEDAFGIQEISVASPFSLYGFGERQAELRDF